MFDTPMMLAAKLAKAYKNHLEYLTEIDKVIRERPGKSPKEEYNFAMSLLPEHAETCEGCSTAKLAEIQQKVDDLRSKLS